MNKSMRDIHTLQDNINNGDLMTIKLRLREIIYINQIVVRFFRDNVKKKTIGIKYFLSLLMKNEDHSMGLISIIDGIDRKEDSFHYLSTIKLIVRAQLEVYVMIVYLFLDEMDDEMIDLKIKIYEFSGLSKRQEFLPEKNQEQIEQLKKEALVINKLQEEIESNKNFKKLNARIRGTIIKKKQSKISSTTRILKRSHFFKNDIYRKLWSLNSNYAHSEYISSIQSPFYLENRNEAFKSLRFSIHSVSIIIGSLTYDLVKNCEKYQKVMIDLDPYQYNIISFFKGFSTMDPPEFKAY